MDRVEKANALKNEGRYAEALRQLDAIEASTAAIAVQILKAELLELVGNHQNSRNVATKLLKSTRLTPSQRALCETVIARIRLENGEVDDALQGFQRAMSLTTTASDLKQLCWIQGKLLGILADLSGPEAATPLISDLRRNITKLGDAHTTAQAHLFVAEMEGRQGHLEAAKRHVLLGKDLLRDSPNSWLSAFAENVLLAVSLLECGVDEARGHSALALALSEDSGAASALRSSAANTGNMLLLCGEFDRAFDYFERALSVLPSYGERNNGIVEALAQVRLAQNQLSECEDLLSRIDSTIRNEKNRTLYSHRHAELTRARLRAKQGRLPEALSSAEYALELAQLTGDRLLRVGALLTKAEVLQRLQRPVDCLLTLHEVFAGSSEVSPETIGRYESVVAMGMKGEGRLRVAKAIRNTARNILEMTTNIPSALALEKYTEGLDSTSDLMPEESADFGADFQSGAQSVLHMISIAVMQASRPEVVACTLADALISAGCVDGVKILETRQGTAAHVLRENGSLDSAADERTFTIADTPARRIDLIAATRPGFLFDATLNLIAPLVNGIRELHSASLERERRAALWPIEELSTGDRDAIISGHMRELMTFAQRVARTNVNVLITGESGTGKEILAHAIHDFSDRAQKPFVPFNCAAVPRDLLESQLFGHRRGAFTGAERDQLGLIRAAADGTLFLDEVGEMSLDLQPKLLRFLESGEIAPLGEPSPFTVNVRVIAATNANLDDAVRDGRFREDLFYRLNVVRLAIKPLRERRDEIPGMVTHFVAAAARDYQKGQLQVSEDTMERLLLFRWPGNVRQLQNEIRRMVALAEPNATLEPAAISPAIIGALPDLRHTGMNGREIAVPLHDKLLPTISRIEAEMIRAALREHKGKLDPAARALGISRKGLYLKRQRLGL
jgi:DNA-binding NtrC family response regulator/tetratricopeptide (TPR) repeat protein